MSVSSLFKIKLTATSNACVYEQELSYRRQIAQQYLTEQRSTVDSRRHLKNFKMLASHSMTAVLRQSV